MLQMRVEKAAHAIGRYSQLALPIDAERAKRTQRPPHELALQQSSVVAERVMVRAADRDEEPSIRREAIVNRLDVAFHLAVLRIGRMDLCAHKKHERLVDTFPNHTAERPTVNVDACLASGIVMAELKRLRATERVAKCSYTRQVQPSGELVIGPLRSVQLLQAIEDKRHIGGPGAQQFVKAIELFCALAFLAIVLRRSIHHATVRKSDDRGTIRSIETDDDVPVAGQILCEGRVVQNGSGCPRSQYHYRIGLFLRWDIGVIGAMGMDLRKVSRQ